MSATPLDKDSIADLLRKANNAIIDRVDGVGWRGSKPLRGDSVEILFQKLVQNIRHYGVL